MHNTKKITILIICSRHRLITAMDFTLAVESGCFLDSELSTSAAKEEFTSSSCTSNSISYSMDDTMMPSTAHNVV